MIRPYLVICLLVFSLHAQERGLTFFRHFSTAQYQGHNQNWSVTQDASGVMFFGNTSFILRYDGSEWSRYPTPKGGIVRSVASGSPSKMYAGAYDEFGYLMPDASGRLRWHSLSDSLPELLRDYRDVWRIHVTPRGIFFSTNKRLFQFDHEDRWIASWPSLNQFRFSFWVRDRLIIQDEDVGLREWAGDSLMMIPGSAVLAKARVYAMLPYGEKGILIQTRDDGAWVLENGRFNKITWEADSFLQEQQVYGGVRTGLGEYLFATLRGGLIRTDAHGSILQIYNKQSGLPDNTVYDIFLDRSENVWLAMNKGIVRLELYSPLTYWNESIGLDGAVLCAVRQDSTMYVGTNTGLFRLQKTSLEKPWTFIPLKSFQGYCWSLLEHDNVLIAASNSGIFQISGNNVRTIDDAYAFVLAPSSGNRNLIYAGLSNGLGKLYKKASQYHLERVPSVSGEVRYISEDSDGAVWLAGAFDGFQCFKQDGSVRTYHPNKQEGSRVNRLFHTSRGLLFIGDRGIMKYDKAHDTFMPDSVLASLLNEDGRFIFRMSEDSSGNLWVCQHTASGDVAGKIVYNFRSGYSHYTPLARISQFGDMSSVYSDGRFVWFGGYDGLIKYKSPLLTEPGQIPVYPAPILTVHLRGDSLVYTGQGVSDHVHEINFDLNEVRFSFADPGNMGQPVREFRYRLDGFDPDWTQTSHFEKTYTFLPEGRYVFEVMSIEAHQAAKPTVFAFRIKSPLYRTWWAFTGYAILILLAAGGTVRLRHVFLEKERRRLSELVEKKTTELRIANDQLKESYVRLEKTIGIVAAINSETELDQLLQSIFEIIQPLLNMKSGSVLLRDNASGKYRFRAAFGIDLQALQVIELTEEEVLRRYVDGGERVADNMYFIRGLVARPSTDKFNNVRTIDSLFAIRLMDTQGLAGFLFFDEVHEVTQHSLLLLTELKEHFRTALTKARLLNELKQLNEKKNEYLGIVAHDLRNPLTTIVGYSDLLIEDFRKNEIDVKGAIDDLSKIAGVSRHMNRFITELLDISAIESGKVRMELKSSDLKAIVGECEYLYRRASQNKNIGLTVDYSATLPKVNVDVSKISSVIDNLLSNALKYTHPGGSVKVFFEKGLGEVITHVQDTGQGLDEEDLKKVFTSFKRLSSKPTGGEPSTGLGLAIVKKIVELHHGRVWVQSKRGEGSTFSFSLPVDE
ncbi:hypothetical protein K1X84_14510 [bacterium]|nr:hypothetical protein [bacterium]